MESIYPSKIRVYQQLLITFYLKHPIFFEHLKKKIIFAMSNYKSNTDE
jgi:hypothetical protein